MWGGSIPPPVPNTSLYSFPLEPNLMRYKEKSRTLAAFNRYRSRLRWAEKRPEIWNDGLRWYPNATAELRRVAERTCVSLYRLSGAVSLLSPLTPWERSLRGGVRLAELVDARERHPALIQAAKRSTVFNNQAKKAVRFIRGNDLARPTGKKTGPFHANLRGSLGPVTVDSWMYRIVNRFGLSSDAPTGNAQRAIVRAVEMNGTLYGIAPAQVQSIVWTVERDYWSDETANRL